MSSEHEHGILLTEPTKLPNGKILSITETGGNEVHIHVGMYGSTFPRFVIEGFGYGDFSEGLVQTSRMLAKTFRELGF